MSSLECIVQAVRLEAENIHSFELRAVHGGKLPAFTAGAHVDVYMTDTLVRSYSLTNPPSQSDRYVIAVQCEKAGRGGSRHMHESIRVGQRLRISNPRNNFELNEMAEHTVLIAGGIGITPLRSMAARLQELGRPWTLYYCGRNRQTMAYCDEFRALCATGADIHLHVDVENAGRLLDLRQVISGSPLTADIYCCGPQPMLSAFEAAAADRPPEQVHLEYFGPKPIAPAASGFVIELARSRRRFEIAPGKSILDTLLEASMQVEFSCMSGICGSCEARVLAGIPDHRDSILSKSDRDANDRMMICCSGSKTPVLVLDL